MKKLTKITILLLTLIATACIAAACGSIDSISVDVADMQTVYVVGSELNLSGGVLAVESGGEKEEIELSSDGVTITGYDKNTLGEQELTVEYKEKTANFTVKVVSRISAENLTTTYFVGEPFDTSKGSFKITNDDGTSFIVPAGDETITLGGFDTTKAASLLTVTVRYNSGSTEYSGDFTVSVYAVDGVSFAKPNKIAYKSHEEEIDLAGGYLTFKGNGGALVRYVQLTSDMVSGFDPSAATLENRTVPLVQTVTVNYAGVQKTFDISILFSNVSLIRLRADELSVLDWTGGVPDITEEQGEKAIEAVGLYFGLSDDEKNYVTEEESLCVAKAAAVYARLLYSGELDKYSQTFTIEEGEVVFVKDGDVEAVKTDYAALQNAESDIYSLIGLIADIAREFAEVGLTETDSEVVTVAGYLSDVPESISDAAARLKVMLTVYDRLASVPASWTKENVTDYSSAIDSAISYITVNGGDCLDGDFEVLSSWREGDDLTELLYTYCYVKSDSTVANSLKSYLMPEDLETIYSLILGAINEISAMSNNNEPDTTLFMTYYDLAVAQQTKILNSGDDLNIWLYGAFKFSDILYYNGQSYSVPFSTLIMYLRTADYGYFYNNSLLLGDGDFTALWNDYLDLIEGMLADNSYYGQDLENLLQRFVEMSPTRQYVFLCTLNTYYVSMPETALDLTGTKYTFFAALLADYYSAVLSEDGYSVFCDLLVALENYSRRYVRENAYNSFLENMKSAQAAYDALSTQDKEAFNARLGYFYDRYVTVYGICTGDESVSIDSGWQSTFNELANAVIQVNKIYIYTATSNAYYSAYLAAYEYAAELEAYILSNAPESVLSAYYNYECITIGSGSKCTVEFWLVYCRGGYVSYLTKTTVNSNILYDVYTAYNMQPFFADASFVMLYTSTTGSANATQIKTAINSFLALNESAQKLFLITIDSSGFYHAGLKSFANTVLSTDAAAVAVKLIDLENSYFDNISGGTTTNLNLKTEASQVKAGYEALSSADKQAFDGYFAEMYAYYIGKILPEST